LNVFDSQHKHRIQGGLMERYYAVWNLLTIASAFSFPLRHEFVQTRRNQPFLRKVKAFLLSPWIGKRQTSYEHGE
jgi:hypothetical protein